MIKRGLLIILILTLLSLNVNAKITIRQGEIMYFSDSSYTFNQTMELKNIKVDNESLFLNDTEFYTKGKGQIDIILMSFKDKDNFNFSFTSNISNDTVLFKVGDQEFYRQYYGSPIIISKEIEPQIEDDEFEPISDALDPYNEVFGSIWPIIIIMCFVIIIYVVFMGSRYRGI